jgi:hypothetical protein
MENADALSVHDNTPGQAVSKVLDFPIANFTAVAYTTLHEYASKG